MMAKTQKLQRQKASVPLASNTEIACECASLIPNRKYIERVCYCLTEYFAKFPGTSVCGQGQSEGITKMRSR